MSTARETILADIRHHLRNTEPKLRPHVIAPAGPPTDDLSGTFVTALEAVGGHVHRTPTLEQARTCVLELVQSELEHGGQVFYSGTQTLRTWLDVPGIVLVSPEDDRGPQLEAPVGVTEAQLGIAETGTLVLRSDRESHRFASLLPRVHIALLRESQLVVGLGEALAKLQGDGLPPVITFVTGPSRTGDIELTLVVGVHGPEILHVVLVGDEQGQP